MDVYILDCKYQVKSHSFPWFSGVCTAVTAHRNHFLHLYQQSKSSASKVKFRQASNHYKRVLELNYANKTKKSITSQKLGSCDFLQINNRVPNKGKPKKLYKPQYVSKYLEEIGCMPYSLKRQQTFNNYRPVSLLPICGKIFERLISNCLNILKDQLTNLVFQPMILVQINCCPLSIILIQPLIHTQLLNIVTFFWICLRLLVKYGMRGSFLNLNQWALPMCYQTLLKVVMMIAVAKI